MAYVQSYVRCYNINITDIWMYLIHSLHTRTHTHTRKEALDGAFALKVLHCIHRRIWGGAKGCFAPLDSSFAPLWTFETMVSAITGWKLFSIFIKKGHITEDYLFIYALWMFKLYTVWGKRAKKSDFELRSKYSNRAVITLIKQSLYLINLSTSPVWFYILAPLCPPYQRLLDPPMIVSML